MGNIVRLCHMKITNTNKKLFSLPEDKDTFFKNTVLLLIKN